MEIDIGKRQQTLLVLWFAFLMNIVVLLLVAFFVAPDVSDETSRPANSLMTLALAALGVLLVVIAFVVNQKLLKRSVDQQDVNLVQKGFILAWAICEVSALMGLLERFVIGNFNYLLFIIAVVGIALHYPRREHLVSAIYKRSASGGAGY